MVAGFCSHFADFSLMNVLSGSVLKRHLQAGVDEAGLKGKVVGEMLAHASSLARANTGVVTNHSLAFRFMECLRLTFSALDYIGCEVNNDEMSDFERMDNNLLLSQSNTNCCVKATWLKSHYIRAFVNDDQYYVKLMSIWNDYKHSAPSFVSVQTYGADVYYVVGEVWMAEKEIIKYVDEATTFAHMYFTATGYAI